MFAGCFSIIVFGTGILVLDYYTMPIKMIYGITMLFLGAVGLYLLVFKDKLNLSSLSAQKLPAAITLRSGLVAGGSLYFIYQMYKVLGFSNPLTILSAAMAVSSVLLMPYHLWLYAQQGKDEQ